MASLTSITGKAATSTKATSPIAKPTLTSPVTKPTVTSPVTKPTVTPPTTTPRPVKAPDSVKVTSLRTSTGRIVAKGDLLLMRYQGNIINSNGSVGAEFDANFNFSTLTEVTGRTPFEFELGAGKVIQGWEQGLLGRRIGEVVELTIPPSLGYGSTPPRAPQFRQIQLCVSGLKSLGPSPLTCLPLNRQPVIPLRRFKTWESNPRQLD